MLRRNILEPLGNLAQWIYDKDSMDGAFIEKQMFSLSDREFKHNYHVDVTDPAWGFLPGVLRVSVDDSLL